MRYIARFVALSLLMASLAPPIPASAAYETGGVVKTNMSNGLTLLVRREADAPVIAIEVFLRVGAADEAETNTGIGQLLAGTILAGTETCGLTRLGRLMSEVGGNFHAYWRWNYLEVYAVTIPGKVDETISLLSDTIQESGLDQRAIDFAKSSLQKEAKRQEDDAFTSAYAALRRSVQSGSVYDRPELGDSDAIKRITQAQLKAFYEKNVSPDRMVVSVVGNIDPDAVTRKVERSFGGMEIRRSKPGRMGSFAYSPSSPHVIRSKGTITYDMLGYPAPGIDSPDYPAMCVANVLFGGNKSSLLFTKLREEKGLGYQVGSLYPPLLGGSHVAAYLGIDSSRATPEQLSVVRDTMLACAEQLRKGGFTDDDLRRAKGYLAGHHAVRHERTRDRAYLLGWHEAIGLGYQYDFLYSNKIDAVTRQDVIRVCARYLVSNPTQVVLQGTSITAQGP